MTVALLLWPLAASRSDDDVRAEAREKPQPHALNRAGRFATRVDFQLESLSVTDRVIEPGQRLSDPILFDQLSRSVRRSVERATRDTVKELLLEATTLDRRLATLRVGSEAGRGPNGAASPPRGVDFNLGFYRCRPEAHLRYRTGDSTLKLSLGVGGKVGLRYTAPSLGRSEINAGYDGDERFVLGCRIAF